MTRKPIYAHKNETARIVSVPNDLWRVQVAPNGIKGTRENDPWQNRSHPISKDKALVALGSYAKV